MVPEFHFDFDKLKGLTFEEGMVVAFRQMEDHYNKFITPKPYVFGADSTKPHVKSLSLDNMLPVSEVLETPSQPLPLVTGGLVRMKEYEIKSGASLGLKEGMILTGVADGGDNPDWEVFDYLKDYSDADQFVTGESNKYDLGRQNG